VKPIAFGKYTLLMRLASGGMAELFLARFSGPAGVERLVVIKLVASRFAKDPALLEMFTDEARIAATLDHPNIGQVLEVGEVDGHYYLAMEHIHGKDLRNTISAAAKRDAGGLPIDVLVVVASRICAALDYAHEATNLDGQPLNIIHRDVSPSNIMLTYHGGVKLVDFGIAKAENRLSLTRPGCIKGKIRYLSPEQMLGESVDRRSDIYTLGVTLWEAAVGHHLFSGSRDFEVFEAISSGKVPPPSSERSGFPHQLEQIVMKALSRAPGDRYESAREMQEELEQYAAEGSVALSDLRVSQFVRECFAEEYQCWEEARRNRIGLLDHLLQVLRDQGEVETDQPLTRTDDKQTIPPAIARHRRPSSAIVSQGTDAAPPPVQTRPGKGSPIGSKTTADSSGSRKKTAFMSGLPTQRQSLRQSEERQSEQRPSPDSGQAAGSGTSNSADSGQAAGSGTSDSADGGKQPKKTAFMTSDALGAQRITVPPSASPSIDAPVSTPTSSPAVQKERKPRAQRRSTPVRLATQRRVALTPSGEAVHIGRELTDEAAERICDAGRPTVLGGPSPQGSRQHAGSAAGASDVPDSSIPTPTNAEPGASSQLTLDPASTGPMPERHRRLVRPRTGDWAQQPSLVPTERPKTHPYFQEDRATVVDAAAASLGPRRRRRSRLALATIFVVLLVVMLGLALVSRDRWLASDVSVTPTARAPEDGVHVATEAFTITSAPTGATVFSGRTGQELGKTPLTLPRRSMSGERLELHLDGYDVASIRLDPAQPQPHVELIPSRSKSLAE
jgi:serine/threonine protein kinase